MWWRCEQCGKEAKMPDSSARVTCVCGHVDTSATERKIEEPVRVSRGLGDTIAKITKAIGITPCGGCKERQEALNKMVPYST